MEKLNVNEPILTSTGLPCRVICIDFNRTIDGLLFNLVVGVETDRGEQLCLSTETGETRNDLFDIENSVNLRYKEVDAEFEDDKKPLISWD